MAEEQNPTRRNLPAVPRWYAIAHAERGVKEVSGAGDNPRILEYLRATLLPKDLWHDSTAHCAAFVCWCLAQSGHPNPRYASARSFLAYGSALTEPRLGCIAVFWRGTPDSGLGHVGFWTRTSAERHSIFGANQRNEVCSAYYPAARLLGFRWPPKAVPIADTGAT